MNRQLLTLETPRNQTTHNQTTQSKQEQKINLENLKRVMNGKKTTLPLLRNIEWRTVKMETE